MLKRVQLYIYHIPDIPSMGRLVKVGLIGVELFAVADADELSLLIEPAALRKGTSVSAMAWSPTLHSIKTIRLVNTFTIKKNIYMYM